MKSFMFVAFVAIALILGLSNSASAQGFVSGTVNLAATVSTGLTIDGSLQDGDMGDLTQGECYNFSADGVKNPDLAAAGWTPPGFTLAGNPYDNVEVSLMFPIILYGDGGGTLIPTDWIYAYNGDGGNTDPFFGAGSASGPFIVQLNQDGNANVFLGAKLCVGVGQPAGSYVALIGVEAHYILQP